MNTIQEKEFFIYWIKRWDIDQLKTAFVTLINKGHGDLSQYLMEEISKRDEILSVDECLTYAVIHYKLDRKDIYLAFLKYACSQDPQNIDINFGLAQYYIEIKEYHELNKLVLHMETFLQNHPYLLFLKGLCVLELLHNFSIVRELWSQSCMRGSKIACDGLKELDQLEMIDSVNKQEAYQKIIQEREALAKQEFENQQQSSYGSNDFMKDIGRTAAQAAMFSIVGGLVSSLIFGGFGGQDG